MILKGSNQLDARKMQAELAKAQAEHQPQGTRTDLHHTQRMKLKQGSNQAAYLLRRLARDHSDILAAYERSNRPGHLSSIEDRSSPFNGARTSLGINYAVA